MKWAGIGSPPRSQFRHRLDYLLSRPPAYNCRSSPPLTPTPNLHLAPQIVQHFLPACLQAGQVVSPAACAALGGADQLDWRCSSGCSPPAAALGPAAVEEEQSQEATAAAAVGPAAAAAACRCAQHVAPASAAAAGADAAHGSSTGLHYTAGSSWPPSRHILPRSACCRSWRQGLCMCQLVGAMPGVG
jgi:hypothetical protein